MTTVREETAGREPSVVGAAKATRDDTIARTLIRHRREDINTAEALDLIDAAQVRYDGAVTMPGQRAYTAPVTLPAGSLVVPAQGPPWQVLDARDETTWHDLTEIVGCADPGCTVELTHETDECIVLVSAAWSDGFAHLACDEYVSVRIPASVGGAA